MAEIRQVRAFLVLQPHGADLVRPRVNQSRQVPGFWWRKHVKLESFSTPTQASLVRLGIFAAACSHLRHHGVPVSFEESPQTKSQVYSNGFSTKSRLVDESDFRIKFVAGFIPYAAHNSRKISEAKFTIKSFTTKALYQVLHFVVSLSSVMPASKACIGVYPSCQVGWV